MTSVMLFANLYYQTKKKGGKLKRLVIALETDAPSLPQGAIVYPSEDTIVKRATELINNGRVERLIVLGPAADVERVLHSIAAAVQKKTA